MGGSVNSPTNTITFVGLGDTRAHLRSVENGWIANITGAPDASVSPGAVQVRGAERAENAKYDATDSFYVRIRVDGEVIDTACESSLLDVDAVWFQEIPAPARPVPDNVGVDQPNFFVRSVGEEIVEVVDKRTGVPTILKISDDYIDPRIEPSGRVLWLREQEEGEQLRVDLDAALVTRIARA